MSFEVKKEKREDKTLLKFIGGIDEEAVFPEAENLGSHVFVDLSGVGPINSIGIRSWILWFGEQEETKFSFLNCPKGLVMQMNMVEGFLPPKSEVISLEVPFFCEKCDEERDVLFEIGVHIKIQGEQVELEYDHSKICTESCMPELDVNEMKYFKFLFPVRGSSNAA